MKRKLESELVQYIDNKLKDNYIADYYVKIESLEKENERLKKIIAKELSENDELGAEYTYVQCLKSEVEQLKRKLEIAKRALEAIINHSFLESERSFGHANKALKEIGE